MIISISNSCYQENINFSCMPCEEASILWSHHYYYYYYYYYYAAFNAPCVGHKDDESQAHEETRELLGERDTARNNARCTQARKATHGLRGQHQDVDRRKI